MGQESELEVVADAAWWLPRDLGGEDAVTDGEALAERRDGLRVDTRGVRVFAIRGRDVDGAPGGDTGDDRLTTVLEELREVGARGVVLIVPKAGDGGYGLARIVERPTIDRGDSLRAGLDLRKRRVSIPDPNSRQDT